MNTQNAYTWSSENPPPPSLSRWKFNKSSVLTSGEGSSVITFWNRTFFPNASMAQSTFFSNSTSSWIFCRDYRLLRTKICGSGMMVQQNIFWLRCVTTSILPTPGDGLDIADMLLSGPQSLGFLLLGPPETRCLDIRCLWIHWRIWQHGLASFNRHRQHTGYVWPLSSSFKQFL